MVADLEERFAGFAARLRPAAPYRDPWPAERRLAMIAIDHIARGHLARGHLARGHLARAHTGAGHTATNHPVAPQSTPSALTRLGFSRGEEIDAATGRPYAMYVGGAWGVVLVDLSMPARVVVEVPHPNSDLRTERMGARLFRLVPGSVLLMAGAHRRAAGGAADVAHNDRSLFNALAAGAAGRRLPQVQLHGFADRSLPGLDAVISTGTTTATPAAVRVTDRLRRIGLATCQSWQDSRGRLEGIGNVQALTAERLGTVFIHLELNWRVRGDERLRSGALEAVAAADIAAG
ncbi:hypothetical protein HC028_22700 [Planosporangium flavigriseum]|uniref:Uncharacterized protein n=1 Tax=Planosporangium flavigriseum TaxID=373681 RepID=A0A8J3LPR7_9ACTN|nr:hypothetical protein [Planosporangium flavigriseum]NJC67289.1 hypothetical protein [Planosporangium flavigriseum]GIG75254.1 hypothetical protein Pfl04_36580 [Planosporangium flavigriseum]